MKASERDLTYLSSLTREIVRRLERAGNALLNGGVATVIGRQDRVLEPAGVQEVYVELAVLALLSDCNAGADRGDVGVVDQSYDGLVLGEDGADGALRTSCATGANLEDFHLHQSVTIHRLRAV